MACALTTLPSHILVDITSYLDIRTLKQLSPLHSSLREICEIHLLRSISLPLSNHFLRSAPLKPSLAKELEGYGWKDDIQQSNHLDASLRYLIPLLAGREGYVKELSIDLKHRYHDPELDLDNLTNPTYLSITSDTRITTPIDKYQDPPSELDILRSKASLIRQRESPTHLPHLANTFTSFPLLPGVRKLKLVLYESFTGYLPYLLPLFPNLTELILEPHELLVESPLSFSSIHVGLPKLELKKLRVEPMLDSLRGLVRELIQGGTIRELVLGDGRWTMSEELAGVIRGCEGLSRVEVGKKGRKVLLAGD